MHSFAAVYSCRQYLMDEKTLDTYQFIAVQLNHQDLQTPEHLAEHDRFSAVPIHLRLTSISGAS